MLTTSVETSCDPVLNMARQSLYRFAALCLLDPKASGWRLLDTLRDDHLLIAAGNVVRVLTEARPHEMGLCERPLLDLDPEFVLSVLPESRDQLNSDYESTFGLLVSNACPPYETEYIDSKFTFQRSNTLADVSGFYHAFGLRVSKTTPERPDHIVQELEFMAFLIGQERRAGTDDPRRRWDDRLEVCRAAQTRFLSDHLAWWAPVFGKLLGRENPDGFYAAVGRYLSALIAAERGLLSVELKDQGAGPSTLERPEACDGCLLASE